ncbi:nucleoside 2-deoxyribosyltransferase [Parapusillimonas granuli]|uniref:Nucleoside 2-deoxyribosyltransferase n=1 Tax=Parapusillimonas granuli TaxID=380911 RepID=A0A853FTX9_9BURK|nr:nucleoside 2-deoxyribosyltransferase [Parapusillimonas granuli]MEB2399711.1 nucleoside 2-deoxyribosyltransferase [Alcaligenaceae bacterium]NYT48148.1 nucleoside 2-deoxyribosyltransferase [Parapusillimonas granuli]
MKTIYLAGFDVFRPDARAWGSTLKLLCSKYGYEGLYPLDNETPSGMSGHEQARWICKANIALIQRADIVMANVNPFRGAEPDSGTVFEVGYAAALGKPVWVYTSEARPLVKQVATAVMPTPAGRCHIDAQGYTVEDFGLNLNLMIACSAKVVIGSAEDCLAELAE